MPLEKFNTDHFFDNFSFGDEYPNQMNPLEVKHYKPEPIDLDQNKKDDNKNQEFNMFNNVIDFGMFRFVQQQLDGSADPNSKSISYSYFLKVVPTTYVYLDGRVVNNTYQYSVTKSAKVVTANGFMNSQLPGIFVNFELSAIMIKYVEKSKSFAHFLTSCCAIIGGLFTIAGMLDSFTYHYYNVYKKYQLNKLT